MSETKPNPTVETSAPKVTTSQAKQHLKEVNDFIFSDKFNGKNGYNPYQWAGKHNIPLLSDKLENNSASEADLAAIMKIPKNEEPKAVSPHVPRTDVFFAAQHQKAAKEKQAAVEKLNQQEMSKG